MSKLKTAFRLLKHDRGAISTALFSSFSKLRISHLLSDKTYLKWQYRTSLHKKLDLKNPKSFNEKLQWLKLYDRKSEYTEMVDKYAVRNYVAEKIGEEYLIPLLGVWDNAEEIDFDALPEQFVLKCNHDSGSVTICKNKKEFDKESAIKNLNERLKKGIFYYGREWPYKNVKPRIIAEQYMVDESGYELKDYKFFCFNGEVKAMFVATDRYVENEETKFDFYDENFNHLPFKQGHPNAEREIKCPPSFEKMKELASMLSKGIPHVRIDFYDINGQIYFGEITFFHFNGAVPFEPEQWDYTFGEWIKLPKA